MISSGFTNAPISKYALIFIIASSIAASVADVKYLFYIQVVPHLWTYWQIWRLGVWQLCYTNSTEVLFAAMLLYHLRVIERLWGSRKFGSFLLTTLPYTTLLPPLLLALLLRPLSLNTLNYLPAGPTAILFALLAQFYAAIPHAYKYRISTSTSIPPYPNTSSSSSTTSQPSTSTTSTTTPTVTLSDKSTTYLLASQLALSQFPHTLLAAATGWVVGYAWRSEILPGRVAAWRVPGSAYGDLSAASARGRGGGGAAGTGAGAGVTWRPWSGLRRVTGRSGGDAEGFEGLRRRLEGESRAAAAGAGAGASGTIRGSGRGGEGGDGRQQEHQQRRPLAGQILDRFTGSF
ncbi:hypothetical protein ACO22_07079 [Paracoccidioides brasiliensis]|uniref:Peptidase S54 rhomboid domain-containing protein n=1 Tax=Paracoccidioides brasiliensis TaxID=121759 RepID=A0A1D2J5L6_PARBR|nr:hypothetical protein ACO22_07079 [Paracoccidioides brasiliensis]